jgi:regulator of sigma E protease
MILISILVFFLLFSSLILVHEAGHFFAARWSGVRVLEFGLGFGKKLWKKTKNNVEYSVGIVPFGGYVRMLGEQEESEAPDSFEKAKLWKRMVITLAGIFMNFVFAIILLTGLFTAGSTPILISEADVDNAVEQGLIILGEADENGNEKIVEILKIQVPFPQSIVFAVKETWRISSAVVEKAAEIPVKLIATGKLPDGLAGPVGIAEATHRIIPSGFAAILKLTALLSISLAVMNLLPIPALDGGRFLFQIIELIIRKKIHAKFEMWVHTIGFALLMLLIVAVTWQDLVRIFS